MKLRDALEHLLKRITQSTRSAKGYSPYENLLNRVIEKIGALALCQYEWRACGLNLMLDIMRNHPVSVYKDRVHTNIYYVPPREISAANTCEQESHQQLQPMGASHGLAELRAAQKLEVAGRLAGGTARDCKDLITVIHGYTELLRIQVGLDPSLQANLKQIPRAGSQAAAWAQRLLAFGWRKVLQGLLFESLRSIEL